MPLHDFLGTCPLLLSECGDPRTSERKQASCKAVTQAMMTFCSVTLAVLKALASSCKDVGATLCTNWNMAASVSPQVMLSSL